MSTLILLVSIFLIRLPAINLGWNQGFTLTTHILVKILTIFLFLITIISNYTYFQKKVKDNKLLFSLIFLYLVAVTLSITHAINLISFFSALEKYFFSVLLFFIVFLILNKKNFLSFLIVLIISTIINLFFQNLVYFLPNSFKIFQEFLYYKYVEFNLYQFGRNRFFGDTFDEALIPIIILLIFIVKNRFLKVFFFLILFAIIFISVASNWRTKSILMILGILGVFFVISRSKKIKKKRVVNYLSLILISGIFFTVYISNIITLNIVKTNVFDRFFYNYENGYSTLNSRLSYWKEALMIGLSFPLFGAGVGNYFDNLSSITQRQAITLIDNRSFILIDDPHNLFLNTFSTMGIFGLLVLIILLTYFFISDIKNFGKNPILQAFTLCFWLLFAFGLVNPTTNFSYLCFFWIMRGFIEKLKYFFSSDKTGIYDLSILSSLK